MVEDKRTGDMWIGTMRGLNRYSAGHITTYLQTTCGLPNNVIYGWTSWRHGLGGHRRGSGLLNLKTGEWTIFDHTTHHARTWSIR